MIIIKIAAESNGAHANQTSDLTITPPEGWAAVPDSLLSVWEQYAPFVTLTVTDGVITGMADNPTARAEQEAADAEAAPAPTQIDRVEAQAMYTALLTDTLIEED